MAESLSVRSEDPPRREPPQTQLAGEVKRKARRLQAEKSPEDLIQRLQATRLHPDEFHATASRDQDDLQDEAERHWQMPNTRPVRTSHLAGTSFIQSGHSLSEFELSLNEEQLEQRLMNYHLRSDEVETMDRDISFRRPIPGNEEQDRCPFVGTDVKCDRCGSYDSYRLPVLPGGNDHAILPPRNPGPWQRSQWLRTRYTPPAGSVEPRDPDAQVPASWTFPDPPLPALVSRRIHSNRDYASGIRHSTAGQRTVLSMEYPLSPGTTTSASPSQIYRVPTRRESSFDRDDLHNQNPYISAEPNLSVPHTSTQSVRVQTDQPVRAIKSRLQSWQYPSVPIRSQSETLDDDLEPKEPYFWHHEFHRLEHRD